MGADREAFAAISAEFITQALLLFEEGVADSKVAFKLICGVVSTLQACVAISADEYDNLAGKIVMHSAKLLKKPQQCRSVAVCSRLYWVVSSLDQSSPGSALAAVPAHMRQAERVLECLQRCLKICQACIATSPHMVGLFIDVLESYTYFCEAQNPDVKPAFLASLTQICVEHFREVDMNAPQGADDRAHFNAIINYFYRQKVLVKNPLYADLDDGVLQQI